MTSIIVTSLLKTGPCLSSVLVEEMLKTSGVNRDTARKQISRAASAGQIHCVDKLFPKRERFIYLKQEYGTGRFWSSLNAALLDTGSAYGLALSCLRARGDPAGQKFFCSLRFAGSNEKQIIPEVSSGRSASVQNGQGRYVTGSGGMCCADRKK